MVSLNKSKKKALAIACALSFMANFGVGVIASTITYASSDDESYEERQRRYQEYLERIRLEKIENAKSKYRSIVNNNGMDKTEYENVITKAATAEVDGGSVQKGMDVVNSELVPKMVQNIEKTVEAENNANSGNSTGEIAKGVAESVAPAVAEQYLDKNPITWGSSGEKVADATSSSGGLSAEEAMAYQAVLGVIGGIPLSDSVSYTPSGRRGTYVCVPADSNSLHPAANDSVTYNCTGVPFAPNTAIIPPVQQITMKPSEAGNISQSIQGVTLTYHHHWVEVNSCGASVTANSYDGGNTMSGNVFGGFSSADEWRKQIEALGDIGEEYLNKMDNGFGLADAINDGTNSYLNYPIINGENADYYDPSNPNSSLEDAIYNGYNGGGTDGSGGYSDNDVYPIDANGYTNDVLNDMYGDGDGSFNSGGIDWASSNSNGNYEGTNLDDYFNSGDGSNDYSINGENIGGITNDILGIDSSFDSANGEYGYGEEGDVTSDLVGIATTNADGVPGYYDADGNFIPYDKEAYERFKAMNAERESMGEMGMSWEDFKTKFGLNDIGNEMFGDMEGKNSKSSLLGGISMLKNALASIFGEEAVATMTEQQMFDAAKKFLLASGYSLEELANGANYDEGSIYTEPKYAWDMNRITKLLKLNKIEIKDDNDKLVTPKKSALGNATKIGGGYLKSAQQQKKINKK